MAIATRSGNRRWAVKLSGLVVAALMMVSGSVSAIGGAEPTRTELTRKWKAMAYTVLMRAITEDGEALGDSRLIESALTELAHDVVDMLPQEILSQLARATLEREYWNKSSLIQTQQTVGPTSYGNQQTAIARTIFVEIVRGILASDLNWDISLLTLKVPHRILPPDDLKLGVAKPGDYTLATRITWLLGRVESHPSGGGVVWMKLAPTLHKS